MGGFFVSDPKEDLELTLEIADRVASNWNKHAAAQYQLTLSVSRHATKACCHKAAELFDGKEKDAAHRDFFPLQPGPFKRAAAFVVLGRLHPFFIMQGAEAPGEGDSKGRHAWLARFLALSIAPVLRKAQVQIRSKWRDLDQWNGFPSRHYQLEFLAWIRWLDNFSLQYLTSETPYVRELHWQRLARMVMSTSLMIEACYYLGNSVPNVDSIQAQDEDCLKNLNPELKIDLEYIEALYPPETEHERKFMLESGLSDFHRL